MRKYIKNNVLPYTFASVSVLVLATYDLEVKSISGLWHTEYWMLYTFFVASNALLFMFGDNQITNKLAGLSLIGMLLFPVSTGEVLTIVNWEFPTDYLHHLFAVAFFIIKPLNHRRYDAIFTYVGAATLAMLGLHLYTLEVVGLYSLLWQGYLTKKNYFRDTRAWVERRDLRRNKNNT